MKDFTKLARQMRADWDRRVSHDYRFWMTESHTSDEEMWRSGERDLEILLSEIPDLENKSLLEIGCGVGRLIRAAKSKVKKVIGIDVSEKAIEKASELITPDGKLELHLGDGFTLKPLADKSIDIVSSFAAITSIPTEVIANYLREINRVVKDDGVVRLQIYLGEEQIVASDDTLHIRCYKKENFIQAVQAAGFEIDSIKELVLPIQVSFKEIGIEALIVSFKKVTDITASTDEIAQLLLPSGEESVENEMSASDVECWMSLNYAKDLSEAGDIERAKEALEYALAFSKTITIDVSDLLAKVVGTIEKKSAEKPASEDFYEKNLKVLCEKFPNIAEIVKNFSADKTNVEIKSTEQGKVVSLGGICLDHPDKPQASAKIWAERLVKEKKYANVDNIIIFGFAFGYHVEALQKLGGKNVSVIEPSVEVFKAALHSRDLTEVIRSLDELIISEESVLKNVKDNTEIALRPQTQALHGDYCNRVKASFYGKRGLTTLHPTIAVLGPMQGGTLPINSYSARALISAGKRTRVLDMSGFAGGYHNLSNFVFDKMRQSHIQGSYVEMMSKVIIESINEKPVDILICMAQAPISGQALSELRKRGIITVLWFVEDHLRFTYWKEIARYYDFVFTIQKGDCIDAIKAAGAGEVHYLPVACDPIVHLPQELTPEEKQRWGSPISFVGAGYHNRQQMLAHLCEMPFKIWGTEWPDCKPFDRLVQEKGRRLAPEEYVKIFNSTDININLHSSSERDGVDPYGDFVNPRTFELAACGAFQLIDERSLLPELFEDGKEVVTFKNTQDLKDKIAYYTAHPEERRRIAENSRQRVLKDHTYLHRYNQMLSIIFASKYEKLKEKEENSPWIKMLKRSEPHKELHERCDKAFKRGEEPNLDGLVADIVSGKGKLSETEQKLLFLYHVRKQIIRMRAEEGG